MDRSAVVAILASALLHAAWNALLKRSSDVPATAVVLVAGAGLSSGLLALTVGPSAVPLSTWPWVLSVAVIEALYFLTLTVALRELPLGTAYGVSRGGGLLLTWPFSIAFLGEQPTARTLTGAALLSAGLFVSVRRTHAWRGIVAASLCAVAVAVYPVNYQHCLRLGVAPFSLFALSLLGSLPIQLATLGAKPLVRIKNAANDRRGVLALASVMCAASFLTFLYALERTGAGRASALRNTSVLFAAVIGWATGDAFTWRSGLAAAGITLGAVLVTL